MKKRAVLVVCMVLVLTAVLYLLSCLVMPKFMTSIPEGALIAEYYEEEWKEHDVLMIGDCELYENISPITLWEEYGITSYIRGSAQQLIWQSYYLLEDTLRYEKPEIFVFNVLSMKYDTPQSEAYNRMSIDGMRWSSAKMGAIRSSMTEDEEFLSYVFPLLRYHSRWSELSSEDFTYMFHRDTVSHNGYLMQTGVRPVTNVPTGKKLPNYQFSDICYEYLDKMIALCRENDIIPVLVKAPSVYPYWYDEWDAQMEAYAAEHDILYLNFLEMTEEIPIDFSTDTYDNGLHLNVYGAEKLASYFGRILKENYQLTDHRQDEACRAIWEPKAERYYQEKKG